MVHGRGCNPHRCTTTFANLEITSLWRHWWRHNLETIRDREKRRPPRAMKSFELSNGENRIALRQLLQNGNDVSDDVIIWVQDGNWKKPIIGLEFFPSCHPCSSLKALSGMYATITTAAATVLWPLYRTTCISRHPSPVKNRKILLEQIYCPHAVADGS